MAVESSTMRFYAAFYRWSRYTRGSSRILPVQDRSSCTAAALPLYAERTHHVARQRRSPTELLTTETLAPAGSQLSSRRGTRRLSGVSQDEKEETHSSPTSTEETEPSISIGARRDLLATRHELKGKDDPILERPGQTHGKLPAWKSRSGKSGIKQDANQRTSTLQPVDSQVLASNVRSLMRQVASNVVIITVASVLSTSQAPQTLGTTVSSFNTVSLDPPHVSFNIKCPSQCLEAVRKAKGLFCAHVLSDDASSASIADLFSKGNDEHRLSARRSVVNIKFANSAVPPRSATTLTPQIDMDGVLAAMECELVQEVPVADHVIVVAKILALSKSHTTSQSTLLYHDGKYKTLGGSVLQGTTLARLPGRVSRTPPGDLRDAGQNMSSFQDQQDQDHLVDPFESHVESWSNLSQTDFKKSLSELEGTFRLPTEPLDIDVELPLAQSRGRDGGTPTHLNPSKIRALPLVNELYGRLTPRNIATLIERFKQLVVSEPRVLDQDHKSVFRRLGLSMNSQGLLASDLLEPLRIEGLAKSSESIVSLPSDVTSTTQTVERLEQVELKIRLHLSSMSWEQARSASSEELLHSVGEGLWALSYIKNIRHRILTEAHSAMYSDRDIDFFGELSLEEARIVIARLADHLAGRKLDKYRLVVQRAIWKLLYDIRVHPMISGVDPTILLAQFKHVAKQANNEEDLADGHQAILDRYFIRGIFTIEEVQARMEQLIAKHHSKTLTWSRKDLLAAMGIDGRRSSIKLAFSRNRTSMLISDLVPATFAQALVSQYGKGNVEQDESIAQYLKQTHDLDSMTELKPLSEAKVLEKTTMVDEQNVDIVDELSETKVMARRVASATEEREAWAQRQQVAHLLRRFGGSLKETKNGLEVERAGDLRIRRVSVAGSRDSPESQHKVDLNSHEVDEFKWRDYMEG